MTDLGGSAGSRASHRANSSVVSTKGFDPGRIVRLLVCGGRDFYGRLALHRELRRIGPSVVIQGGAKGADSLADEWAHLNGTISETYNPDWIKHGKAAGPIRNQQMLDEGKPDAVLACPGGSGTTDMVRRARAAGIPVIHLVPTGATQ